MKGILLIILGFFIYGIFFVEHKPISDKEYYEMKYQQEKKETLKDIQKAVDEYKYQQYKQNK
ncbi:hypothetical protein [Aliarcobacter butzleri]|uniref:hypothetical protein n=1 Tax=Aliarcobacter butzleri TaxID=28197 RepID=UPI0024DEEE3A|nr:hypothetical protein [Aliarcobacter butzleri]MDK2091807.1 hypothetical protein [Aliarcobacter butzleri]